MKKLLITFVLLLPFLTACSQKLSFIKDDLNPRFYNGYWAMHPINNIYRAIKFLPNGQVKIYDYSCHQDSNYHLNEIETYSLRTLKKDTFSIFDEKKNPFAQFEILKSNSHSFSAKQFFYDKTISPQTLMLSYSRFTGVKPLCY